LVVERTAALFAAWLFVVVVLARALAGQRSTLERLDGEVEDLRKATYAEGNER
jgi:hypothetical protein